MRDETKSDRHYRLQFGHLVPDWFSFTTNILEYFQCSQFSVTLSKKLLKSQFTDYSMLRTKEWQKVVLYIAVDK